MSQLLTNEQAANYIGFQPSTLNHWRCSGRGPRFLRLGRYIRYRTEDLEAWLDAQPSFASTSEISAHGRS